METTSAGSDEVAKIAALLNSATSPHEKIHQAAEIIDFKISPIEEVLAQGTTSRSPEHDPKKERILRWVLTGLTTEKLTPDGVAMLPETHLLIHELLLCLPEKITRKLLAQMDLFKIFSQCLQYTMFELAELARKRSTPPAGSRRERQAIRSGAEPAIYRLQSILRIFKLFQRICNTTQIKSDHQIFTDINLSVERASSLVGNGLWCILLVLYQDELWNPGSSLETELVHPLLALFDHVKRKPTQQYRNGVEQCSSPDRSTKLSQQCLLPALGILTKTNQMPILEAFVLIYCIDPFKRCFASNGDRAMITEMFEGIRNSAPCDPELDPKFRFISGKDQAKINLPMLVKLSGKSRDVIFKNGAEISLWYQQIFAESMNCLGIESLRSEDAWNSQQVTSLNEVLLAFKSIDESPGLQQLSRVVLRCTELDPAKYASETWKTIKTSLEIQHKVVTSGTKEATQVLSGVFAQIANADKAISTEAMKTDIEQDAFDLLLVPLLEAFATARKLTSMLEAVHLATMIRKTTPRETFWEAPKVQYAIQQKLVQSLTETEFIGLIEKFATPFLRCTNTRSKVNDDSQELYASTVILSTLLECWHETRIGQNVTMQQLSCRLYVSIVRLYHGSSRREIHYQLLQILNKIIIILYPTQPAGLSEINSVNILLLSELSEEVYLALDGHSEKSEISLRYENARAACRLLVNLCDYCHILVVGESLVFLTSLLNLRLRAHLETAFSQHITCDGKSIASAKQIQRPAFINWDVFSMTTPIDSVHAFIAILADSIWIWDGLSMTDLEKFSGNIYANLFLSHYGSVAFETPGLLHSADGTTSSQETNRDSQEFNRHIEHQRRWTAIWDSLQCNQSDSTNIFKAIRRIQLSSFLDSGAELLMIPSSDLKIRQSFDSFAITQLKQSNPGSFSKDDRSRIIDHIFASYQSSIYDQETSSAALQLLQQVLQNPTRSAASATNLEIIWLIASRLEDSMDIDNVRHLCTIVRAMISFSLEIKSTATLQNFHKSIEQKIEQPGKSTNVVTDLIMATAIAALDDSNYRISHESQISFLEHKFQHLIESSSIDTSAQMLLQLESIELVLGKTPISLGIEETKIQKPFVNGCFNILEKYLHDQWENNHDSPPDLQILCYIHATKILARLNGHCDDTSPSHGLALKFASPDTRKYLVQEFIHPFKILSVKKRAKIIQSFTDPDCQLEENQLVYLDALVSLDLMAEERTDDMRRALHDLSYRACDTLDEPQSFNRLLGWLKVYTSILKKHSWAAKQDDIDNAIQLVDFLAGAEHQLVKEDPKDCDMDLMLSSIMNIVSLLFRYHRQKISGRWNLAVKALNGILACFFITYSGTAPNETIPQPTWLIDYDKANISVELVNALSRLLSDICDPTHHALRTSTPGTKAQQFLNDESKKARAISGQHIQDFIKHYCTLLLKGKMIHQDALKPGIYAIFDAMSQDVQKSCSDNLSADARAIFRNLYEDWKKFGRWDGH